MNSKTNSIPSKMATLASLIDNGCKSGFFSTAHFKAPATKAELYDMESKLNTSLPDEFREFCLTISRIAPCPYTPIEKSLPELHLDNIGAIEIIDFLSHEAIINETLQPFPLTTLWEQFVPDTIFGGGFAVTQVEPSHYNRAILLEGLPKGASPFDGLYELMSELHYCDSWFVGFYLVIYGAAKGQIWMCYAQITESDTPNFTFKPLADSFLDWYITWLAQQNIK